MWCAVSVDGRLDVNVALNRPAYQVSTYTYDGIACNPGKVNDGNSDMFVSNCAHSEHGETNPWWAVDLGAALYVQGVKFTNRDSFGTNAVRIVFLQNVSSEQKSNCL